MTKIKPQSTVARGGTDDYTLRKALTERGKAIATMMADTAFLTFWIILTWVFNTYFLEPLGQMTGLDAFTLRALQVILGVPVIITALSFTLVDISVILKSTVDQVKKQWSQ